MERGSTVYVLFYVLSYVLFGCFVWCFVLFYVWFYAMFCSLRQLALTNVSIAIQGSIFVTYKSADDCKKVMESESKKFKEDDADPLIFKFQKDYQVDDTFNFVLCVTFHNRLCSLTMNFMFPHCRRKRLWSRKSGRIRGIRKRRRTSSRKTKGKSSSTKTQF